VSTIKFGTDGWRGVIADDFTFSNVRKVACAIARYVVRAEKPNAGVLVGYDTRYGSERFARAAASGGVRRLVQLSLDSRHRDHGRLPDDPRSLLGAAVRPARPLFISDRVSRQSLIRLCVARDTVTRYPASR
jgi:hypothetical protein